MHRSFTIHQGGSLVTFDDTPELRDAVFEKVVDWFAKNDSYAGEQIMQADDPQINAPVLMSDLADDYFRFKVSDIETSGPK